jgi:hypothetical protein
MGVSQPSRPAQDIALRGADVGATRNTFLYVIMGLGPNGILFRPCIQACRVQICAMLLANQVIVFDGVTSHSESRPPTRIIRPLCSQTTVMECPSSVQLPPSILLIPSRQDLANLLPSIYIITRGR